VFNTFGSRFGFEVGLGQHRGRRAGDVARRASGGIAMIGQMFWRESTLTDYGNRPGIGVGRKIGMLKPQFKSLTDSSTRQDFGTIAVKTAAAA
jgi:hypothetical protein